MKTKHLPRKSGIYEIKNIINGKFYIGSAVDLQVRLHHHQRELRHSKHHSAKLQNAWNKYGENSFEVRVLEFVDDKIRLLEREQVWLDKMQSVKNGYNIAPKAGSVLGLVWTEEWRNNASQSKSKTWHGFISPDGQETIIQNMRSFCRERELNKNCMYALAKGKVTTYKGWTHKNAKKRQGEWINKYEGFINPNGEKIPPVINLEKFCKENNLCPSTMNKLHQGKVQIHKGWTHINTVKKPRLVTNFKTYHGFINPKDEKVVIKNLLKFCRDNDLDDASMWKLMQGKYPQYKGWRYPAGGYIPPKRQTRSWRGYISPEGKPTVIENLEQFCKLNGLCSGQMSRLRSGERITHKGWTYDSESEKDYKKI